MVNNIATFYFFYNELYTMTNYDALQVLQTTYKNKVVHLTSSAINRTHTTSFL